MANKRNKQDDEQTKDTSSSVHHRYFSFMEFNYIFTLIESARRVQTSASCLELCFSRSAKLLHYTVLEYRQHYSADI